MMETYGAMVIRNVNGIPLHIVEIKSCMVAGVAAFSSARDALEYVKANCVGLRYDPDFEFCEDLVKEYRNGKRLFSERESREVYIG